MRGSMIRVFIILALSFFAAPLRAADEAIPELEAAPPLVPSSTEGAATTATQAAPAAEPPPPQAAAAENPKEPVFDSLTDAPSETAAQQPKPADPVAQAQPEQAP